jgi:hypothetical protein
MFVDTDGVCRVATAAHVVQHRLTGKLQSKVRIVNRFGHELDGTNIVKPRGDLDLAFVEVKSGIAGGPCTPSRLGIDDLSDRIERAREAFLNTTNEAGEQIQIRVERRAQSIDDAGGTLFAISAVRTSDALRQGMSGSPVMYEDFPLGLLTEVDPAANLGVALRFDAIKRTYRSWLASSGPAAPVRIAGSRAEIVLTKGKSLSAEQELAALVEGKDWSGNTVGRVVELELRFPQPVPTNGVVVARSRSSGRVLTMSWWTSTEAGTAPQWVEARVCDSRPGDGKIDCRIAQRTIRSAKLTFVAEQDGEIGIGAIDLQN